MKYYIYECDASSIYRKISIRGTELTFSDVVKQLEDAVREGKGFILNPIVGVSTCI